MNKYQSNKMNAYQEVKGTLEMNENSWKAVSVIVKIVKEFYSILDEIDAVTTRRELDTTGETLAKNIARKDLARHASKLAACGMAYAFDRSDPELEAALDYSYSEIEHIKDADALQISETIYEVLNRDLPGLEEYLVSGDDLRELNRLINRFDDAMVKKGAAKSKRVADTRALASLFSTCDDLLSRKLDRLVARMKDEHLLFHDAYFNARMIKDL